MSRAFKVGDLVEMVEGTRNVRGRQFGVPYTVVAIPPDGGHRAEINGGNGEGISSNDWFGSNELCLWWNNTTVIVDESAAQDSSRGVFVSLELDTMESAERNVKVYADVLSALKDANGSPREVFFVPYPTAKAGIPVWEAIE